LANGKNVTTCFDLKRPFMSQLTQNAPNSIKSILSMKREAPKRIVVFPKDVTNITGLKRRAAQRLLQNIREDLGKPPGAFVSVAEFASYVHMTESEIRPFLDMS
jgi:hypothetical protein